MEKFQLGLIKRHATKSQGNWGANPLIPQLDTK